MLQNNIDFIVFGDANMDFQVKNPLPIQFLELVENGTIIWDEIEELPGGSGLNFCVFAKELGYNSLLFSKVGNDSSGIAIKKWLDFKGIYTIDNFIFPSPNTGKAIIIRDVQSIRLLINNVDHANHHLSYKDIEKYFNYALKSTIIYISGYSIMNRNSERHKTVVEFIDYISKNRLSNFPLIVFDVVPHRIYEIMPFDVFYALTNKVDILISEVSTLRRFWQLGDRHETINNRLINETIVVAEKYYKNLILRFGPSGCDEQIVWKSGLGIISHEKTNHNITKDKRGFGDKIAILALKTYFGIDSRP